MAFDYEFLAIGGGSAGFNGARVARGFSDSVAIVDGARQLGGLCILRGCMPSKTLLYPASILHRARLGRRLGLDIPTASIDMPALAARKKAVIGDFAAYRERAMLSGRYTLLRSQARFRDPHTLELADGSRVTAARILIATGSRAARPPIPGLDLPGIWTSDEVLDLEYVPESVLVLGGGFVACELAQFLRRIGSRVIQIQRSERLMKDLSPASSSVVETVFREEGIELYTGTRLLAVNPGPDGFRVDFDAGEKRLSVTASRVVNALGRSPDTKALDLEAAGVAVRPSGHIAVNAFQQTSQPHIYAGGDCTGPLEIVHLAVQQGELAAKHAFGAPAVPIDPDKTVAVVFTDPPVARCGITAAEARQRGIATIEASYPFNDHGKSILMEELHGHVAVIADRASGRILGAEIAGPEAGELIHVFSTAIALGATVEQLLAAPWYHPTLAEIITYPLEEIAETRANP